MNLADKIDQLLPQTQCGLCTYKGCKPYAEAIAKDEAPLNLCPPGGLNTLRALGKLLAQDVSPFEAEMQAKAKPTVRAVIREHECIGCTKCIKACPLDAIVGAAKQMHTIIQQDCSGCELCISPCPVDCIDLQLIPQPTEAELEFRQSHFRQLHQNRQDRLQRLSAEQNQQFQTAKQAHENSNNLTVDARKAAIAAALARVKQKKNEC